MATRGRKPKPTALKILDGTRADRLNPSEPKSAGRPEAPAHLDAVARAEWERIVPELHALGVLGRVDGAALAMYCVMFERWIVARKSIEKLGLTVTTEKGGEKTNPAVTVAAMAEAAMHRLLVEFGATPSARARLSTGAPAQPQDKLSAFLSQRKAR